jgi:hypothetical protein
VKIYSEIDVTIKGSNTFPVKCDIELVSNMDDDLLDIELEKLHD